MPRSTFTWLCLSDFHFGLRGQKHLWPTLREAFLVDLSRLHQSTGPWDAILFTGDLVQKGESTQFRQMQQEVLDVIWNQLAGLGSNSPILLAVPGNHDLYRPDPNGTNAAVDALLEPDRFDHIATKFWEQSAGDYRNVIRDAFAAYEDWWSSASHRPSGVSSGMLPGDFAYTHSCGDRKIGFIGLNTTFLQLGSTDYRGKLVWDARQLEAVCGGAIDEWSRNHDVAILLTHQGPDWLTEAARMHGESEIVPAGRFVLHLFGHQHELQLMYQRRGGSTRTVRHLQSASAFGMETFGDPPVTQRVHGYSVGRIDFRQQGVALRFWPRVATCATGYWRYIPDHNNMDLEKDGGTKPEVVPILGRRRSGIVAGPFASNQRPGRRNARVPTRLLNALPARRPFFGRERDLERIAKYLDPEDRSWGVVLDGPGGIGKSALAIEAASRAPVEHFPVKIWITAKDRELTAAGERSLPDFRVANYEEMLRELGRILDEEGIVNAPSKDLPTMVKRTLSQQRALLVLDNLESLNPDERRRIFDLLSQLPNSCRAIITSRRRTDGAAAAYNLRLDKLERTAALDLLRELGKKSSAIAQISESDKEQLYVESGGNPLILTWTVSQLGLTVGRSKTAAEAIGRLKEANRLHQLDGKNDPLAFIFQDIVDTLTPDEVQVLAALVPFSTPAKLSWLQPLTEMSDMATLDALDGLRDRALLIEDDVAGTWLLPPLTATYLRRVHPESVSASGSRLTDHVYALVQTHHSADRSKIEAEWPQMISGLENMYKDGDRKLQKICELLQDSIDEYGHWSEALFYYEGAAIQALTMGDFVAASHRATELCGFYVRLGQFDKLAAAVARANDYLNRASYATREDRSMVLAVQGYLHYQEGRYNEAIQVFNDVIKEAGGSPNSAGRVRMHMVWLGASWLKLEEMPKAEAVFREVRDMAVASADDDELARIDSMLGEVALGRSEWADAEKILRNVLDFMEQHNLHSRELHASTVNRLGKALLEQRRPLEALPFLQEAVCEFEDLHSPKIHQATEYRNSCMDALDGVDQLSLSS